MNNLDLINKDLMQAVIDHNIQKVKDSLEKGANPNFRSSPDNLSNSGVIQPDTPLKMIVFRISDALLKEGDIDQCIEVAKLLLEHGADPKPALELALERYGEPQSEEGTTNDIYSVIKQYENRTYFFNR